MTWAEKVRNEAIEAAATALPACTGDGNPFLAVPSNEVERLDLEAQRETYRAKARAAISAYESALWRHASEAPRTDEILTYHPQEKSGRALLPATMNVGHVGSWPYRRPTQCRPLPEPPA